MKRTLYFILSLLMLYFATNIANAQEFEFDTIKTIETPGFFMVQIFPNEQNTPLPIQNIFVANYQEKNEEKYKELLPFVREFGGKIIPTDEIDKYSISKYNRIIVLGEPIEGFLNFKVKDKDVVLEEFETFTQENLGPILLQDVKANFGGNISEVFPETIHQVGFEPFTFIGKFEHDMKTRMEITGVSANGEMSATAPLELENIELTENPLAKEIPAIWEEMWKTQHGFQTEKWYSNIGWIDFFPVIILLVGILAVWFGILQSKKNKDLNEEIEQSVKTEPHKWDNDIPFEIEKK